MNDEDNTMDIEEGAVDARRKRRRARHQQERADANWAWLRGISPTDRSWLYFALYAAYQAQVRLSYRRSRSVQHQT